MDQIIKPEFLKKLTKFILLLIWVLSLLTTHNFYLYRFAVQLVTHGVDKNYIFLLCNGLLVFVAKYSGLIAPSKPVEEYLSNNSHKTFDYRDFESYNAILELEYSSVHGRETESFLAEEVTENSLEEDTEYHQETEEENDDTYAENDREEEEEEEEESDLLDGFINEEEEESVGVMDKKFDEFIRKMKEELRIEARRQLILV